MDKIRLDADFLELVRQPINRVWAAIAPDVDNSESEDVITNTVAIECCLDADRIKSIAQDTIAATAITLAIQQHTRKKLMKFLMLHIHLA